MGIGHCDFGVRRVRQVVIPGRFVLVSGSYLDTLVDIGYRPPLGARICKYRSCCCRETGSIFVGSLVERTALLPTKSAVIKCCDTRHIDNLCSSYRQRNGHDNFENNAIFSGGSLPYA
jgi:hypothetical protein